MQHLWMRGGEIPPDLVDSYQEMELCEMYHCTPSELDEQDIDRVRHHLAIRRGINRYREADNKARQNRPKKKPRK